MSPGYETNFEEFHDTQKQEEQKRREHADYIIQNQWRAQCFSEPIGMENAHSRMMSEIRTQHQAQAAVDSMHKQIIDNIRGMSPIHRSYHYFDDTVPLITREELREQIEGIRVKGTLEQQREEYFLEEPPLTEEQEKTYKAVTTIAPIGRRNLITGGYW